MALSKNRGVWGNGEHAGVYKGVGLWHPQVLGIFTVVKKIVCPLLVKDGFGGGGICGGSFWLLAAVLTTAVLVVGMDVGVT